MQDVSAEWILNQNSRRRKQGFVATTIETPDGGEISIDTRGATGIYLQQITHERKYDPLGFVLPENDIVIDLYNYDGTYDDFYKNYAQERLRVEVKYGYRLTNDETIPGGIFYMTDVSLSNKIITVTAKSTLGIANEDSETVSMIDTGYMQLYTSTGEYTPITNLASTDIIYVGEICSRINNQHSNFISYTDITSASIIKPESEVLAISDVIQKIASGTAAKCFINRNDNVVFNAPNNPPIAELKQLNMRANPIYSRTKQVQRIEVKTEIAGAVLVSKTYGQSDVTQTTSGTTTEIICSVDDLIKYELISVTNGYISTNQNWLLQIAKIERNDNTGQIRITVNDYRPGTSGMAGTGNVTLNFRARRQSDESAININNSGEICDVSNDLMPPDTTQITNYFSNRDIYELDLRGDPAIDVGDYVYVEFEDGLKKALVLESELTFDGAFKDNMKVRIIDTDFETITGNTHAQLAAKKHSQLANYTHKKLMTEAI